VPCDPLKKRRAILRQFPQQTLLHEYWTRHAQHPLRGAGGELPFLQSARMWYAAVVSFSRMFFKNLLQCKTSEESCAVKAHLLCALRADHHEHGSGVPWLVCPSQPRCAFAVADPLRWGVDVAQPPQIRQRNLPQKGTKSHKRKPRQVSATTIPDHPAGECHCTGLVSPYIFLCILVPFCGCLNCFSLFSSALRAEHQSNTAAECRGYRRFASCARCSRHKMKRGRKPPRIQPRLPPN